MATCSSPSSPSHSSSSRHSVLHHRTERVSTPVQISSLLEAATYANENAVALALHSGADVNACDASGRTVITCAIGGERWEQVDAFDASFLLEKRLRILRMLLEHTDISLHALNAPQGAIRGATPLGLAAWLDIPDIVQLLLEHCPGLVSVDGMDALGATALMYAARDGNVVVMRHLLVHGARPDYRDINHRTSVQHALQHPQALWLCECALRRHRARESIAEGNRRNLVDVTPNVDDMLAAIPLAHLHPRLLDPPLDEIASITHTLISAVFSSDPSQLNSILHSSIPSMSLSSLPTILINHPDGYGWSPIHYCVSVEEPSRAVLDVLYRAGADVSLYTADCNTPLHCLAFKARTFTSPSIRSFVHHLVFDLRAPLSATNRNKETCIHISAQRGQSMEVLAALLACDPTGKVREMRNAQGLTAAEVCRPEFRTLFGSEEERCGSSMSVRTIKPSTTSTRSSASLASLVAEKYRRQRSINYSPVPLTNANVSTFPAHILDGFHQISLELSNEPGFTDIAASQDRLGQVAEMSEELMLHMHSRVDEAAQELDLMREKLRQVESVVENVTRTVENTYGERFMEIERVWDAPDSVRRRTTDSGDSESTAVSETGFIVMHKNLKPVSVQKVDVGVTACVDDADAWRVSMPPIIVHPAPIDARKFGNARSPLAELEVNRLTPASEERGFMNLLSPWMKDLPRRRSKINLKMKSMEDMRSATTSPVDPEKKDPSKGTTKLKAWFKKKILSESHSDLVIVRDLDGDDCRVGHEVKGGRNAMLISGSDHTLRQRASRIVTPSRCSDREAARRIIASCNKDLSRIQGSVHHADRYLTHATRSISQAERIIRKFVNQREASIDRFRLIQQLSTLQDSPSDLCSLSPPFDDSLEEDDTFDFLPVTNPSSPRDSLLIFPRPPPSLSSKSSVASLSSKTSTLIESDEEDLRNLRRLITRKIDSRIDTALEEIEKVTHWLRIVREAAVGLKKRTQ